MSITRNLNLISFQSWTYPGADPGFYERGFDELGPPKGAPVVPGASSPGKYLIFVSKNAILYLKNVTRLRKNNFH